MNVWPLRFREYQAGKLVFANEGGSWFLSNENFLHRYGQNTLADTDKEFLTSHGHAYETEGDLTFRSFLYKYATRHHSHSELNYVILVPTLRCNLSCSYCQVSRAAENAQGYDWSNQTAADVLAFLNTLTSEQIKVEFQGGEPLLRLDLLKQVREFCRSRFRTSEFVVCTNLQQVSSEAWEFLSAPDTYVSTSLDGPSLSHTRQRTKTITAQNQFEENLALAVKRLGARKISALPTIDAKNPPDLEALIESFEHFGFETIFLRPISYHGFARIDVDPNENATDWKQLYRDFINLLIARNWQIGRKTQEFYLSLVLKRILMAGHDGHVDLRNPSYLGINYLVVDYDGRFYPTDEARMLARIGHVDLSIGSVEKGVNSATLKTLNQEAFNDFDAECIHCPYQPFCGRDAVDDIGRYGRVDVPRHTTRFCQRQLAVFDLVFELLDRDDDVTRHSLAAWSGLPQWPKARVERHS